MTSFDADAIIVGGGLTGLAAAISAAKAGLRTIHLAPPTPPDRRTSALMEPSVRFLLEAGLIASAQELGHPLRQIRIIDATPRLLRAPETLFDAKEIGMDAFGWNFANAHLTESFQTVGTGLANLQTLPLAVSAVAKAGDAWTLTLSDGRTLTAPLVIGADGKKSLIRTASPAFTTREHNFEQSALVCDLTLSRPLNGASVEFHYPNGPFTLVPAGIDRANLVWIDRQETLQAAKALAPDAFAATLRDKAQGLFGTMSPQSAATIFSLSTLSVATAGSEGLILVGEAAHAFPPIGAQGLNLGLRDVADFAHALQATNRESKDWSETLSNSYAVRRQADIGRTSTVVDTLFRSLLGEMLPAQALRAGGLWALKLLPALRRQAFAVGMGR